MIKTVQVKGFFSFPSCCLYGLLKFLLLLVQKEIPKVGTVIQLIYKAVERCEFFFVYLVESKAN